MNTRTLGSQGLEVSELGLGCMGMSEFYGAGDENESIASGRDRIQVHALYADGREGTVTFKVTNNGGIPHNLRINNKRTLNIDPGATATLKVTFTKPGNYHYLCFVPGETRLILPDALAAQGQLSLPIVIAVAAGAAIVATTLAT